MSALSPEMYRIARELMLRTMAEDNCGPMGVLGTAVAYVRIAGEEDEKVLAEELHQKVLTFLRDKGVFIPDSESPQSSKTN